jgi:citrate/tricarballylate utilization protein
MRGELQALALLWLLGICLRITVLAIPPVIPLVHESFVLSQSAIAALTSLPVLLGIAGGIGLLIGPAGLLWIKTQRDPELVAKDQTGMDAGFLVLLFMISLTGLGLLAFREAASMGTWLAIHLGFVLALFLTMPYGKFVHGMYRLVALVRHHLERRRPVPGIAAE